MWAVDLSVLRSEYYEYLRDQDWMHGSALVEPKVTDWQLRREERQRQSYMPLGGTVYPTTHTSGTTIQWQTHSYTSVRDYAQRNELSSENLLLGEDERVTESVSSTRDKGIITGKKIVTFTDLLLGQYEAAVQFIVGMQDYLLKGPKRIFLSHKGADKRRVRQYYDLLLTLGYDPWLDVKEMPAGKEVDRAIRKGFRDSCAAVFFLTPAFQDDRFLRNEINYAIAEKRERPERFEIITIILAQKRGQKVTVPEPLQDYIWKEPRNDLEAFEEIIRALPLGLGEPRFKLPIRV